VGRIDNERLTLQDFLGEYLPYARLVRVFTGCVSVGPVKHVLGILPACTPLSIIAGSIVEDLQDEIDLYARGANDHILHHAMATGRLKLGFHPKMHMKVWILNIDMPRRRPYLTVSGSSNFTWQGLARRKGEQNDPSRGRGRFRLEEARWQRFERETSWISSHTWPTIQKQCRKDTVSFKKSL